MIKITQNTVTEPLETKRKRIRNRMIKYMNQSTTILQLASVPTKLRLTNFRRSEIQQETGANFNF